MQKREAERRSKQTAGQRTDSAPAGRTDQAKERKTLRFRNRMRRKHQAHTASGVLGPPNVRLQPVSNMEKLETVDNCPDRAGC